jgi:hypothetical protein
MQPAIIPRAWNKLNLLSPLSAALTGAGSGLCGRQIKLPANFMRPGAELSAADKVAANFIQIVRLER